MGSGTFLTIVIVVCAVLAALWIAVQVWREQMDMKQVMAMVAAQADGLATTVGEWYEEQFDGEGVQEYVATLNTYEEYAEASSQVRQASSSHAKSQGKGKVP